MPHYRTMYDRDYIGHFDLPGGKDITLTIRRVVGGELTGLGGKKSRKPIVHFKEAVKPLICNVTNAKTIATLYGDLTEQWKDKRVTLFVSITRDPGGNGEVNCIRIRPKSPNAATRAYVPDEPPVSDDDEHVVAAPIAAPEPTSPSLSTEAPVAATSQECLDILMDIDLAKGRGALQQLQDRIEALTNDDEKTECTAAYNFRVQELKKAAGKGAL